jgi:hypothetical protein
MSRSFVTAFCLAAGLFYVMKFVGFEVLALAAGYSLYVVPAVMRR